MNQQIIRDVNIPKLSLEEQRNITGLHRLYLSERRLLKQLIEEKDEYYQGVSEQIIKGKMGE